MDWERSLRQAVLNSIAGALSLVDKCLCVYVALPTSGEECLWVLLSPYTGYI